MERPTSTSASASKNGLTLKLAESAVFLRSQGNLRRRAPRSAAPLVDSPGILRGLLVLKLEKPIKVSSILVDLTCTSTATWAEGVGARRIDITESHQVFSSEQTFFKASPSDRRRSSVGPGIRSPIHLNGTTLNSEGTGPIPRNDSAPEYTMEDLRRGRMARRMSTDLSNFQASPIEQHENRISVPGTPAPMSPALSRTNSHAHELNLGITPKSSDLVADTPPPSAPASVRSFRGRTLSRQPSFEGVPENAVAPSPSRSSTPLRSALREASRTPVPAAVSPRSQSSPRNTSTERRGRRKSARFSLSAVSNALRDAVRPSPPETPKESSRDASRDRPEARGRSREKEEGLTRTESRGGGTLGKIERYLNLETAEGEWKEFRPGTYTYAISIPIPVDQPPSLDCAYGKVNWRLKGIVHRPGAFKSKLSRSMNVNVIHSPMEEDQEEPDSVSVERHWDTQLQYLVSLSARHFYIGGTIPFTLTLLPLAKIKVHKLTIFIEEKIDYLTQMKRVARSDPKTHILLLSAKHGKNDDKPILPLESDDPDAFRNSPLYQFLDEDDDVSEMASTLMGPGPWTFQKDLQLPASCSLLHWTNTNKRSNVLITHVLKCIIRLERGDDLEIDARTGKRKLFDIVIQTEVDIRSCRCNPDWAGLPPYQETSQDTRTFEDKCPCQIYRKSHQVGVPPKRVASRHSSDSDASAAETSSIDRTMLSLRGTDTLYRNNVQYERLVSGQETVSGEVPPPYPLLA